MLMSPEGSDNNTALSKKDTETEDKETENMETKDMKMRKLRDRGGKNGKRNTAFRVCLVVAALLCVAGLAAGCGQKKQVKDIDVEKLAADLINQVKFQDQMTEITPEVFEALYQIDKSQVSEAAVYTSTGATAEEVAVIKAASPEDVDDVKKAVVNRVEFQKSEFKDYVPAELDKLADPVIQADGDYVILCISNDNKKAEDVIRSYVEGK